MNKLVNQKANFGTMPVFVTAISTILGAILFLRFDFAVGNTGLLGTLAIVFIGHLITVPTALAVAEIATNQKVQGGGAYYIISRSFGLNIGVAIGLTLYLSQAISVAFYIIAFAEAFLPYAKQIEEVVGFEITNQIISIPAMAILSLIILVKGANVGMKALYVVAGILFIALGMFFAGEPLVESTELNFLKTVDEPANFFFVFTLVFPAFTGLAAGLGLSGDLKNPSKSIPLGTMLATLIGGLIYVAVAFKLSLSASPEDLASKTMVMQRIALWGPIIPIGLAAASLSSALGSIMVAPRTLQAIGLDNVIPNKRFNKMVSQEKESNSEPVYSSIITIVIAFVFVIQGEVDFVAQIISMFFMFTYGAICLISFLEHFAADPSYRPTFKSRWYFSLMGAVLSIWLMFKMDTLYAVLSLIIIGIIYIGISKNSQDRKGLQKLFKGVIFQLSRQLQVFAQRANKEELDVDWRPFAICITEDSFKRRSAFDMLRWISYKYGFGTYIHYINGFLSQETNEESRQVMKKLINLAAGSKNRVYLDTIISPSYTSAIAQVIQLSGISGKGNNMILFEFSRTEPGSLEEAMNNYSLIRATDFDTCVLNTSYKGFGYRKEIHIWISSYDYENANLMILLGYIILGHPEWSKGFIKLFAMYEENELEDKKQNLLDLIKSGRLPIAPSNIELISKQEELSVKDTISQHSVDADLTIVGFRQESVKRKGVDIFTGYDDIGNILFVNSNQEKEIC